MNRRHGLRCCDLQILYRQWRNGAVSSAVAKVLTPCKMVTASLSQQTTGFYTLNTVF